MKLPPKDTSWTSMHSIKLRKTLTRIIFPFSNDLCPRTSESQGQRHTANGPRRNLVSSAATLQAACPPAASFCSRQLAQSLVRRKRYRIVAHHTKLATTNCCSSTLHFSNIMAIISTCSSQDI
mmetsp:Transcript_40571/g.67373  ORF Transcript_40571/g.67373 Transcript_40571/m.67373 type:complete len:123 (-) Transcript_40571:738-1106(-)